VAVVAGAAAAPRGRPRGPRCGRRSCAIRAATSFPSDQPDFLTAIKFVNALREVNVEVQRATRSSSVNGKQVPGRLVRGDDRQAFRPHVIDMFEPQDHPNVIPVPGAPPTPPYDTPAGRWPSRWACSSTGSSSRSPGRSSA
jgi:hypothetical protein